MLEGRHLARHTLPRVKRPEDGVELGLRAQLHLGTLEHGEGEVEERDDGLRELQSVTFEGVGSRAYRVRTAVVHRRRRIPDHCLVRALLEGVDGEGRSGRRPVGLTAS